MRRILLAGISAIAMITAVALGRAQAAPVGQIARSAVTTPGANVELVQYNWHGHRYHHRRWHHHHWSYY